MAGSRRGAEARRRAARLHASMASDLRRLRQDAGVSRSALATAAEVDLAYLCRIEEATARPTIDTYAKLATALGADLSVRLYPNTGPAIHDRHQARILEALLGQIHPRWRAYPEVAVRQPSRGWIDCVLHGEREGIVVATEIESDLRRLEQLLRWFPEKVASLPSWEGWSRVVGSQIPSQLLIVRSTRAARAIGRTFATQLEAAYPAHPSDALAALTGDHAWPEASLISATIEVDRVRFSARR